MKILLLLLAIIMNSSIDIKAGDAHPVVKTHLEGRVTDFTTGHPLPGVSIYFPDLKTGTATDDQGYYRIENLPLTIVLVQVSLTGYKLHIEKINLQANNHRDFELQEAIAELNEIVVTGLSQAQDKNRTPVPITSVTAFDLKQLGHSSIIDAIAAQPGLSQISTGPAISKPVIRGLSHNRVVVIHDGIRQEGQQWGDEHGIEIDEFGIDKVEIIKGPASLSYGSDALAGVINMLTSPTLAEGRVSGSLLATYHTNNGMMGLSGNVAGNQQGFIWDVRLSGKRAHAYQNKLDGYVFNSGFSEQTISGVAGVNRSWGFSHLHLSYYKSIPGIIEGERDSATGLFVRAVSHDGINEDEEIVSESDLTAYEVYVPYQNIQHLKAVLNNSVIFRKGYLKIITGWQQNRRQEFGDIILPEDYGLHFLLNTLNYDIRYVMPEHNHFNLSFGVNGMSQQSHNKGVEFLIPEYSLFDGGIFFVAKKSLHAFDISAGVRYDMRFQNVDDLFLDAEGNVVEVPDENSIQKFSAFDFDAQSFSASLGATWQLSEMVFGKLNFSRGFRAPNIPELASNGLHEGTQNYIIGNAALDPEKSLQADLAIGFNSEHITAEIDVFDNHIDDFIFLRKLQTISGLDSITEGQPTFKYTSGQARLRGGEILIDLHPHPLDWLHFENSLSIVLSNLKNSPEGEQYLPFTPPAKASSEIIANAKKISGTLSNAYFRVGIDHYFAQDRIYRAYDTETSTPAYTLMNISAGTDIVSRSRTICSVYLNVQNVTDVAYQSHLSRLKYSAVNNVSGRMGVYQMGRNFSIRLVVPFLNYHPG